MEERLILTFTGDIGFDHYMKGKWDDPELLSREVLDFLADSDHVIANVEGPVSGRQFRPQAGSVMSLMHTMDPAVTKVLRNMHADIWNLCNNHIMDAGEDGVADTLAEAKALGARTVGAGMDIEEAAKPLYFPEAGGVGMFSVGYRRGCKPADAHKAGCLLWNELERIEANIREIKKTCRWCILIAHGGEEFTSLPTPYTRDRYKMFLDMGADLIIGHHPHVPMNYETFPGKAIFYSLGNFIFDTDYQRAQFHTDEGLLVKLVLTETDFSFRTMGLKILRGEEHVVRGEIPLIFRDVQESDYDKLAPLSAKAFLSATKRQQVFLNPDKFRDAPEEVWAEHFANPRRSGRVEGEALDFFVVCPLAEKAREGAWKTSTMEDVKTYILCQIEDEV